MYMYIIMIINSMCPCLQIEIDLHVGLEIYKTVDKAHSPTHRNKKHKTHLLVRPKIGIYRLLAIVEVKQHTYMTYMYIGTVVMSRTVRSEDNLVEFVPLSG